MPDRSAAGDGDLRARVAATLERLARADVGVIVIPQPDESRRDATERARGRAIGAGRGALLEEASDAARDLALRGFAGRGFTGTWAVAEWSISTSGPRDRVAVAKAFEEAVLATVTDDIVDADTVATLRATSDQIAMMTGVPEPGALSSIGASLGSGRATVVLIGAAVLIGFLTASVVGAVVGLAVAVGVVGRFAGNRARPPAP